jgi:hypothetical protein
MNPEELRLECLKLAVSRYMADHPDQIVSAARQFSDFTTGADRAAELRVSTVAELEADKPSVLRPAARQSRIDYILKLKAEGITQAAIAERVGVNQQRISEILRQHRLKQGADQLADGDGFEHAGSDRR